MHLYRGEIVKLSRVISVALTVLIMSAAAVRFSLRQPSRND
jgi:hypothetical protein